MDFRELARRARLAVRALRNPGAESVEADINALLERDYRKKLEMLGARILINARVPALDAVFKLAGPASDQSVFLRLVHSNGVWEAPVSAYIAARLGPGDVFLDIGANLGYFTALAAKCVAPGGFVHAFEASTFTRSFLEETLRANHLGDGFVKVHPVAAWHESATLDFRVSRGAPGGNHVLAAPETIRPHGSERVQAHALSEYLGEYDMTALKLVKIDIEGAEIEALDGLKALLRAHPAEVVCEVNKNCLERLGHSLEAFWDIVASLEFDIHLLNPDSSTTPLATRSAFLEAYPGGAGQHIDAILRPRKQA